MSSKLDKMRAKQLARGNYSVKDPHVEEVRRLLTTESSVDLVSDPITSLVSPTPLGVTEVPAQGPLPAREPLKPAKENGPVLKHKCGHYKSVRELENLECGKCRNEKRQEKAKRRFAEKATKTFRPITGRLPDGTRLEMDYDESSQSWKGAAVLRDGRRFEAQETGVEKLCRTLGRLCRGEAS